MKSRKFWKKALSFRWLIAYLIVILVLVFVLAAFVGGLKYTDIQVDNQAFTIEGFVDYNQKEDSELNRSYVVGTNSKYTMFFDEATTVAIVAVNSTFKNPGGISDEEAKKDWKNYTTVYRTALDEELDGTENPNALSNLILTYASDSITNSSTSQMSTYSNSVKYKNELSDETEKHYKVKFLTSDADGYDGVQILYTIGNFSSSSLYFPSQYYATLYKPYSGQFRTQAEYEAAVKTWEEEYLPLVGGSLSNTFEERFRGNVEITKHYTKDSVTQTATTLINGDIKIYSEDAMRYFIDTVLPLIQDEGYEVRTGTQQTLGDYVDSAEDYYASITDYQRVDSVGNYYWEFTNVPEEFLDYKSDLYKEHFNNENSPMTNNPYLYTGHYNSLKNNYNLIPADGNSVKYSYYYSNSFAGVTALTLYKLLYADTQAYTGILESGFGSYPLYDKNGEIEYSCGYVAMEDGKFLYDEDGTVMRALYTTDQVEKDNALFGAETSKPAMFEMALEFKLTDSGIVTTLLRNSMKDSTSFDKNNEAEAEIFDNGYFMTSVVITPQLTTTTDTDGLIIVPDGSGAVINFNSGKNVSAYSNAYYGNDLAYVQRTMSEEAGNLLLGMFGFVNTTEAHPGGILGIIEKGGGQTILTANSSANAKTSSAYFSATLRNSETVKTGTTADNKQFVKWDKKLCNSDLSYNYMVLDETETTYTTVAKKYQAYLIERDNLTLKDDTNDTVVDLNFLGTFERYSLFLGIKYMTEDTLTTFEQAEDVINELKDNGIKEISTSYTSWTSENLEYQVGGSLKVASTLGRSKSMRKFYEFCTSNDITFYPEIYITTTKGYDYAYANLKYTTRSVANETAVHYQYDLSTGRQDKKLAATYNIAPQYYKNITENIISKFNSLNIWDSSASDFSGGFYLTDLGNSYAGNYRENYQVYSQEAILYQLESLELLNSEASLKISAPYDYAFKYVDKAVNVPTASTMYTIFDYSIPFYQLVVNGLFDYSTEEINGLTSRTGAWYLIKAIETGSNLSFVISVEDPSILLDTDYTYYFQSYYQNWKDKIISYNKVLNDLGIHACTLTNHEYIATNISKVTYTNKETQNELSLYVNTTGVDYTYTAKGVVIPAYGYVVI